MSDTPDHIAEEISLLIEGGSDYDEIKGSEYLLNFMNATDFNSPTAYKFMSAFETYGSDIEGFPAGKKKKKKKDAGSNDNFYAYQKNPPRGRVNEDDWNAIKNHLQTQVETLKAEGNPDEPTALKNLMKLASYLGMSDIEKNALEFIFCNSRHDYLFNITEALVQKDEAIGAVMGLMMADQRNHRAYTKAISPSGKFTNYGIIEKRFADNFLPNLAPDLVDVLGEPNLEKGEIVEKFVGKPCDTDLDYEDFEYMGEDLDLICNIIQNAVESGEKGVNILIYGPAGGGKTELTRAISKRIGIPLYSIGEDENQNSTTNIEIEDEFGDISTKKMPNQQSSGQKRMADLHRAQTLLSGGKSAFLLFDEIEDLLLKGTDSEKAADTESKIAVNRMLENNAVPVIWNGNDPEKFHEAVRDRFTFSFYVDHPPVSVRRKIWQKQTDLQGVELSQDDLDHLAKAYDASPRKITLALKAAKVSGQGKKAIEMALPASARITQGSSLAVRDYSTTSRFYDPAFSNIKSKGEGDFSLDEIIDRGNNKKPFSLAVSGVTGSGLRALTRHIAEGMNVNIAEFSMASLSAPPGPMEPGPYEKIMGAFNSAADKRRLLAIHDMEVLAANPSDPNSWEEGLTSLVLSAAREHKLPFILTSGAADVQFPERLKTVFSDQIELQTMSVEQRHGAFETFFGQKAPGMIDKLDGIVPADFANVRKDIMKKDMSKIFGDDIVRLLAKQIEIRTAKAPNKMGFGLGTESKKIELPPKPEGPTMSMYPAVDVTLP